MRYMFLIYSDEQQWARMTPAEAEKAMGVWMAYTEEMAKAGVLRAGDPLKPTDTATTVRAKGGKVLHTDGPFAETKEQLGGYYIVEVPDLDAALRWAGKCPGVHGGAVEIRPIQELGGP